MRLSRLNYDKAHRCPGWSGAAFKGNRRELCPGAGYVTAHRPWDKDRDGDEGYPGHPAESQWMFAYCNKCDVMCWPYATRWLDPGWWFGFVVWNWRRKIGNWYYERTH